MTTPSVTTAEAARATLRRTSVQPATIEPYETADLHAMVGGYVERVLVDRGDRVERGQLLIEIAVPEFVADRREKMAAVRQAVAEKERATARRRVAAADRDAAVAGLEEARAALGRADAEIVRRRSESQRARQLVAEGAVTEALEDETKSLLAAAVAARAEVDARIRSAAALVSQAEAGIAQADADLGVADSHVEVAQAAQARAEAMLGYARMTAPFAGVVGSRQVHPGHLAEGGGRGPSLMVVQRDDRFRVVVPVPELMAALIDVGDPVEIRLQSAPGIVVTGSVCRTAGSLDVATRTLRAEVDVPATPDAAPGLQLRPGLYATATLIADRHVDAVAIPRTAVVKDASGATSCFVVAESRAVKRQLVLGFEDGPLVEVMEGLQDGEPVVISGAGSLQDGQLVKMAK